MSLPALKNMCGLSKLILTQQMGEFNDLQDLLVEKALQLTIRLAVPFWAGEREGRFCTGKKPRQGKDQVKKQQKLREYFLFSAPQPVDFIVN